MRPLRKTRLKRQESRRALEHWRLLYQDKPPPNEKPADLEKGGPGVEEKHRDATEPNYTLTEADRKREEAARVALIRFVLSPERHRLERLNRLVRRRSPAVVRSMELARGLR